jgi:Kef-type K+ transport system membrane component KefB
MQVKPRELAQASKTGILIAVAGVILPLGLGYTLGHILLPNSPYKFAQALFLGTALSITAIPVSIRVLVDLKKVDTRIGRTLISAAVIDDIIGLILLAIVTSMLGNSTMSSGIEIGILLGKAVGFFVFAILVGWFIIPHIAVRFHKLKSPEVEFSIALAFALATGGIAELVGLHFAVGAFIAGLFIEELTFGSVAFRGLQRILSAIALGFLAPFFFVSLGLSVDFSTLATVPHLVISVIFVATIGKLIGCGVTAKLSGFTTRESIAIGWGMNGRGAVELVVVEAAAQAGLFNHPVPTPAVVNALYSSVITMAFITTLVVPTGLRLLLKSSSDK